ncbi:thioesterase II family protein (plasmid) [Streptomyces sp. BI20]|uniref:thioesterase II family protein n=1 Tax=Streptomyces sp. BI20 TaxID=3403460 RepID=UPI003C70B342
MSAGDSVRLFCLAPEGVSAGVYLPWADALGPAVLVTPVELPGHGRRTDRPRTAPDRVLAEILPYVARLRDRPFALYGHGLGALLAHEIAVRLEWEHDAVAERLYVSGTGPHPRPAPAGAAPAPVPVDADLLRSLADQGRIPPGAAEPRRAARTLAALRADLTLRAQCRPDPRHVLHCPLTVMTTPRDPDLTPADAAAWRARTRSTTRVESFTGDPHFPLSARWEVLGTFERDLVRPRAAHRAAGLAGTAF